MAYVVNQPNYPDVNGLKPDFFALSLLIPGLYTGSFPIGLTAVDFGDSRTSGKLRGNAPVMLAKTPGMYKVEACSLTMYHKDYYQGLLPFMGNLGLPQNLGAYEVAFGLDMSFSTPNDPTPTNVQIVGASIGKPTEGYKSGEEALQVKVDLDEPFLLIRNGVVPMAVQSTYWPVNTGNDF
jgi:hypothetical protein